MSLPDEEVRALIYMRQFLQDMLDPKKTPKIPGKFRAEARFRLKHAPSTFRLKQMLKKEHADLIEERPWCKDCGKETKPGAGSARCESCWDDRFGLTAKEVFMRIVMGR